MSIYRLDIYPSKEDLSKFYHLSEILCLFRNTLNKFVLNELISNQNSFIKLNDNTFLDVLKNNNETKMFLDEVVNSQINLHRSVFSKVEEEY